MLPQENESVKKISKKGLTSMSCSIIIMTQSSEGDETMSETGKKILQVIGSALPKMSEAERERFLTFAEGMAFMAEKHRAEQERASA